MTWPEAFAILFGGISLGILFHGFPKIHIGKTNNTTYYNTEEDDNYDDDE